MNQLEEIKKGVEACRTYNFGMRYANKLAHEDADKLIAALEAVAAVCAQSEIARTQAQWVRPSTIRAAIEEALR